MDSTRILVVEKGAAGEYASPDELLANDKGIFRSLWDQHVKVMASEYALITLVYHVLVVVVVLLLLLLL